MEQKQEQNEPEPVSEEDIKAEFQKYDTDGKGFIEIQSVKSVLAALKIADEGDLFDKITADLPNDSDMVAYENFIEALKK